MKAETMKNDTMKTEEKLKAIQAVLDDMKAEDVVTVDTAGKTIIADAFVMVTATSDTHARAIADRLHVVLKEQGSPVMRTEQDPGRDWTIMDFGDVIVHVFLGKARTFYNLEALWGIVKTVRDRDTDVAPTAAKPAKAEKPRRASLEGLGKDEDEDRGLSGFKPKPRRDTRTGSRESTAPAPKGGSRPGTRTGARPTPTSGRSGSGGSGARKAPSRGSRG